MISLPATDQSPNLLKFIGQQRELIARQQEQIVQLQKRDVQRQARTEALKNEIIRLKKLNSRPNIKPNTKPLDDNDSGGSPSSSDADTGAENPENDDPYSRKSKVEKPDDTTRRQRSQPDRPAVSEEHSLSPDEIHEGSVRHGRESFTVQELEIKAKSVCFWLEQWLTPEGKTVSGCSPDNLHGHHSGSQLQAFVLFQHYGCAVTQPQLLGLLWDAGGSISAGELSNLLTKRHDNFHTEKDELLATGIRCSRLHNNLSESQVREHVKRRKISGGMRSDARRQCRETFASLKKKKRCRQHSLSFWDYLTDRLNGISLFPRLADVVEYASFWLPCSQYRIF